MWLLIFSVCFILCSKDKPTRPDTTPPEVRIISPINAQRCADTVLINVVAIDESAIKRLEVFGNDSLIIKATSSRILYQWNITRYPQGTELKIYATATDEYDNKGYSDTVTITVVGEDVERITLFADSVGSRFVKLRWNRYNGENFNQYIVSFSSYADVDTSDSIIARIYSVDETTRTVSGLTPSSIYFSRVFVKKTTGEIFGSNEIRIETRAEEIRDDGAEMIFVDGGRFTMGDSWGDGANDEIPVHSVELPPFYIDKYEVTNRLYARFIDEGGYENPEYWSYDGWQWKTRNNITAPLYWGTGQYMSGPEYPDYPVVGISYYEAEAYARFAGKELPTEAMWEKAARGTDGFSNLGNKWPWGNEFHQNIGGVFVHCNYYGNDGFEDRFPELAPVGSFPTGVSPYGALDMAGNVAEWVRDWYSASYYQVSPSTNPVGPTTGVEKVVRGGSWVNSSTTSSPGYSFRNTARAKRDPTDRKHYIGFRCIRAAR